MRQFEFKNLADLGRDVRVWLGDLPRDFEAVAGIPRSGLLVAGLIPLHRHLPITDMDGLIAVDSSAGGDDSTSRIRPTSCSARRVLVVDDSVLTGRQLDVQE